MPIASLRHTVPLLRVALTGLALAACSGTADGSGPQAFPLQVDTESGALHVEVHTSPEPPVRGTNSVELTVTRTSDGTPVDGLSIDVDPWMAAMNHGTSAKPTVTPEGGGKYFVSAVYLYMPGLWQLHTTISGPMTDRVAPALEIP